MHLYALALLLAAAVTIAAQSNQHTENAQYDTESVTATVAIASPACWTESSTLVHCVSLFGSSMTSSYSYTLSAAETTTTTAALVITTSSTGDTTGNGIPTWSSLAATTATSTTAASTTTAATATAATVSTSLLVASSTASANAIIRFTSGFTGVDKSYPTAAVVLTSYGSSNTFGFSATEDVDVSYVALLSTNGSILSNCSSCTAPVDGSLALSYASAGKDSWAITAMGLSNLAASGDGNGDSDGLYFAVGWNNSCTGTTYSRQFVVETALGMLDGTAASFTDDSPAQDETTSCAATATPSATLSATAGATHKKSISGGAIAGIVVGAVVGVAALVGGLAWFIARRRRRSNGGYNPPQLARPARPTEPDLGATTIAGTRGVGENGAEAAGGVGVAAAAVAGTAGALAVEKHRALDTTASAEDPYTDDYEPIAASTPVLSGHVAALVEDGMTAEDVARLAEEERELDAAIQDADQARAAGR